MQRSRDAKTQNQDKSGATQKQTHKETIKATNEGIGTVNQTQENRESGSKRKKDMDPHTRHKHRDGDTEMVSEIKTKPGTEQDGKRNRCKNTYYQRDPQKQEHSHGDPEKKIRD